jgi:NAD(P)-dependent dehydrogenase (short-subunit alcohol dehydrogenase family)
MEIIDKVAIITGASGGIGLATAQLFAERGARVALVARSAERIQALAAELPDALAVPTDMRDTTAVRQMIAQVQQHYGRIDILINNAGQGMHVPVAEADLDQYRAVFELNVVSVLNAMQAVIPLMRAQQDGGVIINISSGLSRRIVPGVGPYASTKYALNALTLTARMELAPDNIRVGLMLPGITATDFARNAVRMTTGQTERHRTLPADPPEHVAAKILEAIETEAAEVYADSIRPSA